ncbi:MAG: Gfo/Idh/MocA family oxidoreductase [Candidatus Poribacteria bacterium]|nr:Gfo/Idh/MocA family oxidoreductase [Candidatus Poribacteria bacterium]
MGIVNIGIVGSGGTARHHIERFSQMDTAKVVAIASRNAQTGTALAEKYGVEFVPDWQALVRRSDLDGIVICTHNDSHGEIAIAALRCDKHVFTEYPLARSIGEGETAVALAQANQRVLRVSHSEAVSHSHNAIKQRVPELGDLLLTAFLRLTPGRGARPEILFNLPVSGPPAHFFIYHIYPMIDLFGNVAWVEGGAVYEGLTDQGGYNRFANTVNVGFKSGGIGQWTWAGGIEIREAEQHLRYVLTGGTISHSGGKWYCSTGLGMAEIPPIDAPSISLQELWVGEIQNQETSAAHRDAATALEAIRVSLSAEQSMRENRRVVLA